MVEKYTKRGEGNLQNSKWGGRESSIIIIISGMDIQHEFLGQLMGVILVVIVVAVEGAGRAGGKGREKENRVALEGDRVDEDEDGRLGEPGHEDHARLCAIYHQITPPKKNHYTKTCSILLL